jgi:IS30 family transposase
MSKYLTFEERLSIERGLRENMTFGEIASLIGKDRSTIGKEVKKHAIDYRAGSSNHAYNACIHRSDCKIKLGCKDCTRRSLAKCSLCNRCNDNCDKFVEEICTSRFKPPYVCNGCALFHSCTLKRLIYTAEAAQDQAARDLSESRSGIMASEDEIARIGAIITPLIKQGQSLHQIYINNVDRLMCSEKTLYNYIDACLFDVRNIDLPRKVKYRPRYKKPEFKVDRGCRIGRNYGDFQHFIATHPEYHVVEMDSVIGTIGGKVLLTIHFVDTSLMLAFLRDANTSQSVIDIIDHLYAKLGSTTYEQLFPVILTDNGSEFSNPKALEFKPNNKRDYRSHVFYCDPSCPYQKGAIEVNHELIRRVLPKGTSFDNLTQCDINLMMDHINSYTRKKLNNRSPYDAFSFFYGEGVLKKLGCSRVPAEEICLKPNLLKR